jgi:hypothetical protein
VALKIHLLYQKEIAKERKEILKKLTDKAYPFDDYNGIFYASLGDIHKLLSHNKTKEGR